MPESPPPTALSHLPSAIVSTILAKLDVISLCSAASTSRSLRGCAAHTLSFVPAFHLLEIAPTLDLLRPLLPPNPCLRSVKVDCRRLGDGAIGCLLRSSLDELCLLNCSGFTGSLLSEIGRLCPRLRSLSLSSLAEQRGNGFSLLFADLEQMVKGCCQLESLCLAFDISAFDHPNFGYLWTTASQKLSCLKIGYIPMDMVMEMLNVKVGQPQREHLGKPHFRDLQKLSLSVENITDVLIGCVSSILVSLTHLDLQDAPVLEPELGNDLTNAGLQQINGFGKLKHISLIRNQDFLYTHFRRVNDLGILLMAEKCSTLESIYLGGFCRVTDTGFRALLHSCPDLRKFKVSFGSQMTDLVFHDISATSLSLTHVSLRKCHLLTNLAILGLSFNKGLHVLDLRGCRNLGDEALKAVSSLPILEVLFLDGTDITDVGMSYLGNGLTSLISLSVRGCRRLTDNCLSAIFSGSLGQVLDALDLSCIHNISDSGILQLAKSGVALEELRLRECPLIGDTSVMALASMQIDGAWRGSSLQILDLYECRGITQLAFRWLKKPYFPSLRRLGITGITNRDIVDALVRSRPFLQISCRGEELGTSCRDTFCGGCRPEQDDVDELEQWLFEGEIVSEGEEFDEEMIGEDEGWL